MGDLNLLQVHGPHQRRTAQVGDWPASYRYAWAERARTCGYPERFAQEALGHNSKAVHRAYAKRALVKIPALEEYERRIVEVKFASGEAG